MGVIENIHSLCSKENISIAQLERKLSFSKGSIRKWALSSPSSDKLLKVAKYFNTSMEFLLTGNKVEDLLLSDFEITEDDPMDFIDHLKLWHDANRFDGRRIIELREESGLTQEQVSEKLDVDLARYRDLESGLIPIDPGWVQKISKLFNCPTKYILGTSKRRYYLNSDKWNEFLYKHILTYLNKLSPINRKKVLEYIEILSFYQENHTNNNT